MWVEKGENQPWSVKSVNPLVTLDVNVFLIRQGLPRLNQLATASSFSKRIASLRNVDGSLPTSFAYTFSVGRTKAAASCDALFRTSFSQEANSSDPPSRPSFDNHVEDAEMDASAPIGEPASKPSATAVDGASASILDLQNAKPAALMGGAIGGE